MPGMYDVDSMQYALKRQDMPSRQGLANLPLMLKASEERQKSAVPS